MIHAALQRVGERRLRFGAVRLLRATTRTLGRAIVPVLRGACVLFVACLTWSSAVGQDVTRPSCEARGGRWSAHYQGFKCDLRIEQTECQALASEGWQWSKREKNCWYSLSPTNAAACKQLGGAWGLYAAHTEHCFFAKAYAEQQLRCKVQGGKWQRFGLGGFEGCLISAKDAGKPCSDNTECEYSCIYRGTPRPNDGRAIGSCAVDNNFFGCYATVVNGRPGPVGCID